MASAKKKTSAKRNAKSKIKYAAKAQNRAATATASAAKSAQHAGSDWVKNSAAEWQKGAQDWAKQSAKLYQLPFAQGDVGEATKKAAEQVQSATENAFNFANQMFNQNGKTGFNAEAFNPANMFQNAPKLPNFDASDAQEKLGKFAKESAEQINKSAGNAQKALNETTKLARENGEVLVEVTNTFVAASKEISAEYVSYLNKSFSQNVELGKQVLTCRTLNDLFDLGSRVMKTNLDGFFSESIKLSEKLFRLSNDVSEPLNESVTKTTERLSKVLSA